MNINCRKLCISILVALPLVGSAQSLNDVETLLDEGRYLEAAKLLRPFADGGNAKAQAMAAELFFEGKGVNKSDAQGLKYATLSAEQANEKGICLLFDYYQRKKDPRNAFAVVKKYTDRFPGLRASNYAGWRLLSCYLEGYGTPLNESLGWDLFEKNNGFDWNMKYMAGYQKRYWTYKAQKAGKSSLEGYCEYLFANSEDMETLAKVSNFIMEDKYGNNKEKLREDAERGDVWAMTRLANDYYMEKRYYNAKFWGEKAAPYSLYAKAISVEAGKKMTSSTSTLPNTTASRTTPTHYSSSTSSSSAGKLGVFKVGKYRTNALDVTLTKVVARQNYMEITLTYRNETNASQRLTINPNTHIVCNGKTYRMTRCNVPSSGTYVPKGDTYYIEITFPAIPSDGSGFDLIENGSWKFYDIRY